MLQQQATGGIDDPLKNFSLVCIANQNSKKAVENTLKNFLSNRISRASAQNALASKLYKADLMALLDTNNGKSDQKDLKHQLCAKILDVLQPPQPVAVEKTAVKTEIKATEGTSSGSSTAGPAVKIETKATQGTSSGINVAGPSTAAQVYPAAIPVPSSAALPVAPKKTIILKLKNLPVCTCLYVQPETAKLLGGDWENTQTSCNCISSLTDLTQNLVIPEWSLNFLKDAVQMIPEQLVEVLNNYGESNIISGCKNQLLMQLRTLFLEQCGHETGVTYSQQPATSTASHALNAPIVPKKPKLETTGLPAANPAAANPAAANPAVDRLQVLNNMSMTFGQNMMNVMKGSALFAGTPNDDERAAKKTEEASHECCVCLSGYTQSTAFGPCGHAVCCKTCSTKVKNCPICRKPIKSRMNVYFS